MFQIFVRLAARDLYWQNFFQKTKSNKYFKAIGWLQTQPFKKTERSILEK